MWNNGELLNVYNHGGKGNPHPQYDRFLTYTSPNNTSNKERYIKIFEGNFNIDVNDKDEDIREYDRLIYKAYLYNMNSDEKQGLYEVQFILYTDYTGTFNYEISNKTLLGVKEKNIVLYYKTDSVAKNTNVKVYYNLNNNYEYVKIMPIIYDTIRNNYTPYNLKASGYGVNTKEKLDDLYKDFSKEALLNSSELDSQLSDYTKVVTKVNTNSSIVVNNINPKVQFCTDLITKSEIYFSNSNSCMVMDALGYDWRIKGNIIPLDVSKSIGADWANYKRGYFSEGVKLGICTTATRPTTNLTDGLTIFDSTINKLITYFNGKWYSNGVES